MDMNYIQALLRKLIGLPLWAAGRAGNLEWFQFGAQHMVIDEFRGKEKVVGEYALHVQCAWRIISPSGIEVASHDRYYPASDEANIDLADFEWDQPGKNKCDEKISRLFALQAPEPFIVTNVEIGSAGSIKLMLGEAYMLEVFPDSSLSREQWRLFQPYQKADEIVLTGQGFEH